MSGAPPSGMRVIPRKSKLKQRGREGNGTKSCRVKLTNGECTAIRGNKGASLMRRTGPCGGILRSADPAGLFLKASTTPLSYAREPRRAFSRRRRGPDEHRLPAREQFRPQASFQGGRER